MRKAPPLAIDQENARRSSLLETSQLWANLRLVPRAMGLVWAAAPGWTLVSGALLALQGVIPVLLVYFTRSLVNGVSALVGHGYQQAALAPVLQLAGFMALVLVAEEVIASFLAYVRLAMAERVSEHMSDLIQAKAASLDLQFFESAKCYDLMHRASTEAMDRPLALLENFGGILQNVVTLAAMGSVLFAFAWWMPLALLAGTVPALAVAVRTTKRFHAWRIRSTARQRRMLYYHRGLISEIYAAEIRIFGLAGWFQRKYRTLRKALRKQRLLLARSEMVQRALAGLFALLSMALALLWVGLRAMSGHFTLGDIAMLYQAMNQGQRLLRTLLTNVGEIYRNILFIGDLFTFLAVEPHVRDPRPAPDGRLRPCPPLREAIRLENVTFRYPGSDRSALDDFSLTIPAGQVIALVGQNGAGKSTLLKLLCRFYDPQQGRITWDGAALPDFPQEELRRRVTVLFQRPALFHETVADNIAFGAMSAPHTREDIEDAATVAGAAAFVARLPRGYDTILGKYFGHTDLSVGEWQRLALARAFIRRADLIVLDEPTSAMDSWAETSWMERFRELARDRTALIITHRFTTALQADVIHVMSEGRIVESGSHGDLIAQGGLYARSWKEQMRETGFGAAPSAPGREPGRPM